MRCWGVACVIVACGFANLQPAAAQELRPNPPPAPVAPEKPPAVAGKRAVLLVMESAGGLRAAASLRATLNSQSGLQVVSLSDVTQKQLQPSAIVTVGAVTARTVTVAYWDFAGGRDTLSAPAPARADQLDAVVLALASALLERHRSEWTTEAAPRDDLELARTTYALYAALGRYGRSSPRTNVALRFEDF